MSSHDAHDEHGELGHILPFSIYRNVLIALLVLTFVTVVASQRVGGVNFGHLAIVIAMVIASVKALIVALYFMHLKFENPLTWFYAFIPIFLLGLLLGGVFIDNPMRHHWEPVEVTKTTN